MSKIAMLLPYLEMLEAAKRIVKEEQVEITTLKYIASADAVQEARKAAEDGAKIVIARGYQASLIKQYTNIPLVEMRFHAQEIGILIKQAKFIVKKSHPKIGLVVYENMLSDMSHMEELFDIDLRVIYLSPQASVADRLKSLREEQIDIIIGGEIACEEAEKMGYPTLFYTATDESIREAVRLAKSMAYAADLEMQSATQFETVLDTSFNGIIKININSQIITINRLVENLLGKNISEVVGLKIDDVFPSFNIDIIHSILDGRRDNYSTSVNIRDRAWMLMMAPIQYDNRITGAILSLQKISEVIRRENTSYNTFLRGFTAQTTFQHIKTRNANMKEVLRKAENYALADSPILMYASEGVGCYEIAEAIHNNSRWKAGPYLSVDLSRLSEEQQEKILFGSSDSEEKGILKKGENGTVFINGITHLYPGIQQRFCRILRPEGVMKTDGLPLQRYNARLILKADEDLTIKVDNGYFDPKLYYYLQRLVLRIPNLAERHEDLLDIFQENFNKYMQKYNKRLVLTKGALDKICQLPWPGNRIQVISFCERLILDTEKRNVDEVRIQSLYNELYPILSGNAAQKKVVVFQSEEAASLAAVLEKHHGNRSKAAAALGISTTTLWRKMKKYGIEANYGKV